MEGGRTGEAGRRGSCSAVGDRREGERLQRCRERVSCSAVGNELANSSLTPPYVTDQTMEGGREGRAAACEEW